MAKNTKTVYMYTKKGFITVELLTAFFLGISFLSAALMVVTDATGGSRRYNLDTGAVSGLDTFLDSSGLAATTHHFNGMRESLAREWKKAFVHTVDPTYDHHSTSTYISPCSVSFSLKTTWETIHERHRFLSMHGGSTNITLAHARGRGSCDPIPPSSWRNPENPSWTTESGGIVGTQTGLAYAIIDGRPYVFVSTSNVTQAADVWVIDIEDETSPTVIASLETGDATYIGGLLDISVVTTDSGTYAYVLQNSSTNQLQVIDVSHPTSLSPPIKTISFDAYGVNPSGTNPEGRVITYFNNKLYIGLRTTIGPEFLVFDIGYDPEHPQFVGALPNSFDHSIYDIAVEEGYAYLAIKPGGPPSGLPTRELMVIDVRSVPRDTGEGFNATSTANDTEGATTLFLIGNRLYMGRERVSNAAEKDLYVFDISSSTKLTYVKSRRLLLPTSSTHGTPRVVDIVIHGNLGFLVTTDNSRSLQVYDVLSDLNNITSVHDFCVTSLSLSRLTEIIFSKNRIIALSGIEPRVSIIRDNEPLCTL